MISTARAPSTARSTTLRPVGPFGLATAREFAGQARQLHIDAPEDEVGHLHLAFVPDGEAERPVGACVRSGAGPDLTVDLFGDVVDQPRAIEQVERILSLDVDATDWADVGRRDPVIGALQAARPGFRPVNFVSPYEAACWLLLTQRSSRARASVVRDRIAIALGTDVDIHGEVRRCFPGPAGLRAVRAGNGLSAVAAARLRAVAEAALDGDLLDGQRLRQVDPELAVEQLIAVLPGVGPFTAQGIVLRGAGTPDLLAPAEPRLAACVQRAYGLERLPDAETLARVAEPWRPFRSWAQVLLRSAV